MASNPHAPEPKTKHSAIGKVLDAVLTFGAEDLNQKQIADCAGVVEGNVTRAKKAVGSFGPLLSSGPVRFTSEMGLVLAVSVGAERIRAGLVDANGSLHCRTTTPPLRGQLALSQRELLQHVARLAAEVLEKALGDATLVRADGTLPVFAAAMALPTPIDRDHRQVNGALSHKSWEDRSPYPTLNHAFAAILGPAFTSETAQVMNDCNAASIALAFDRVRTVEKPRRTLAPVSFRQRSTIMVVRVGGAVGCGIIEVAADQDEIYVSRFLKSRVMVGTHALAGEIGHMPISESAVELLNEKSSDVPGLSPIRYDAKCACGRLNHLQALIGGAALARRLGVATHTSEAPITVQLEGFLRPGSTTTDKAAARALDDAGQLLGKALVGPVLALDLKAISVIGALARPALVQGLGGARDDWGKAFYTGAGVELVDPGPDSAWMIPRGAGLALMRQHRHRKLRQIGNGQLALLVPPLDLSLAYVQQMRAKAWS